MGPQLGPLSGSEGSWRRNSGCEGKLVGPGGGDRSGQRQWLWDPSHGNVDRRVALSFATRPRYPQDDRLPGCSCVNVSKGVCVCVCLCVCACMYVQLLTHRCVYIYVHVRMCARACMCMCASVHSYNRFRVRALTVLVCVYVSVCVCVSEHTQGSLRWEGRRGLVPCWVGLLAPGSALSKPWGEEGGFLSLRSKLRPSRSCGLTKVTELTVLGWNLESELL